MSEPTIDFRKELETLINRYSKENGSNTPDFILADYLCVCLQVFDHTVDLREAWYGRTKDIRGILEQHKDDTFQSFLADELRNPEFRKAYIKQCEYEAIRAFVDKATKHVDPLMGQPNYYGQFYIAIKEFLYEMEHPNVASA